MFPPRAYTWHCEARVQRFCLEGFNILNSVYNGTHAVNPILIPPALPAAHPPPPLQPPPLEAPRPRTHGFHDSARRLRALEHLLLSNALSLGDISALAGRRLNVLARMLFFLQTQPDTAAGFRQPSTTHAALLAILSQFLTAQHPAPLPAEQRPFSWLSMCLLRLMCPPLRKCCPALPFRTCFPLPLPGRHLL